MNELIQDRGSNTLDDHEIISLEHNFQTINLSGLQVEKEKIDAKSSQLENELSNLAFNNYRTYVDVGKTAEYCKDKFSQMDVEMQELRKEFPNLQTTINNFKDTSSKKIISEFKVLNDIGSTNCFIWEVLKLKNLMEKCIKTGHYEHAYAITNFALSMKQTKLINNPVFQDIIHYLIESRHSLLDGLFRKFSGQLDLAQSIQIVNNIRKIPYISNTQLRISILQYRDIYLEKKVVAIMHEADFILRVIEIYRECMYDTIVLYLAVFPDADNKRKYVSMNDDPRWERWTGSSQNYLLQSWAQHNIERLLILIRTAENRTLINIEATISKLMSFAFSFGRMGLDFRQFVHFEFTKTIIEFFQTKIAQATKSFTDKTKLDLLGSDIFENAGKELEVNASKIVSAPIELCIWDDLCIFGNSIIDAFNEMRDFICTNFIKQIFNEIFSSLQNIFEWLDQFLSKREDILKIRKAALLIICHFIPFVNKFFFHCFPYDKSMRSHFRSDNCLQEEYEKNFNFANSNLFVLCQHGNFFQEILDIQNNISILSEENQLQKVDKIETEMGKMGEIDNE